MTKVKIEIDIPKGHEVDTVRHTNSHYDGTLVYFVTVKAATRFEICGQLSEWPEWLTCDYIAKDKNGQIFGYNGKPPYPYDGTGKWQVKGEGEFGQIFGTAIVIPGPWEQSLRKNPNKKNS